MNRFLFTTIAFLSPLFALAEFPTSFVGFICLLVDLINTTIPVLVSIAFLIFFFGIARFILSAGDAKGIAEGKSFMIYGILGVFLLVSFWGIMQFMLDQFEFGPRTLPTLPGSGPSCGGGR
jgi:TM2 domain-containing membrane protein YozV